MAKLIGIDLPVPLETFGDSARVLSPKDLGCVAAEAWRASEEVRKGGSPLAVIWATLDPAWRGQGPLAALLSYGMSCIQEAARRGMTKTASHWVRHARRDLMAAIRRVPKTRGSSAPSWLGIPELHARHRAALLRSDPYYGRHHWREQLELTPNRTLATTELPPHRDADSSAIRTRRKAPKKRK